MSSARTNESLSASVPIRDRVHGACTDSEVVPQLRLDPEARKVPILRPDQLILVQRIERELRLQKRKVLVVAPTGSGKTIIASHLISKFIAREQRCLFVVERSELVNQTSAKLTLFSIKHGFIKAGLKPEPGALTQVATIQTLSSRRCYPAADLVIIDEAHHSGAKSYMELMLHYSDSQIKIVGLTATPYSRNSKRNLLDIYEAVVEAPSTLEMTRSKHLAPAVYYGTDRNDLDLTDIASCSSDDFLVADIEPRVNTGKSGSSCHELLGLTSGI